MTLETTLTRVLEIRFIDARALATEAKVNLGVEGYASPREEKEILKECIKIFIDRPENEQQDMKDLRDKLNVVVQNIYNKGAKPDVIIDKTPAGEGGTADDDCSSVSSYDADLCDKPKKLKALDQSDHSTCSSTASGSSRFSRVSNWSIFRRRRRNSNASSVESEQ